jgi:hypothetical protein
LGKFNKGAVLGHGHSEEAEKGKDISVCAIKAYRDVEV